MRSPAPLLLLALAACAHEEPTDTALDSPWSDPERWLCRPDISDDVCASDLDATIVYADGSSELEVHEPAADPAFDCFYVYPTVSLDQDENSDLEAGEEEQFMVLNQAARFTRACRVFAPVYQQGTLLALLSEDMEADTELAFSDVEAAWRYYLAAHNGGRGVLLLGHSQGARVLSELLDGVIAADPAQSELVIAAHLIGTPVRGAPGGLPLCEGPDQAGCVVSYLSYRAEEPPGEDARFDDPEASGQIACVDPAALLGVGPELAGYYPGAIPDALRVMITGNTDPWTDGRTLETPFFTLPGMVSGQCETADDFDYLSITVHADPDDPRADEIGGDILLEGWGLHVADVNLAQGDLIALAERQAVAWGD